MTSTILLLYKGGRYCEIHKSAKDKMLGHVKRMEARAMPRRMMEGRLFTGRRKGRPRLRWMDDVVADLSAMRIQRWTEKAEDRQQWRLVVEEAKAHPGL
jgi:hypothetical protein